MGIGVLGADKGGFSLFTPLASFALNALVDSLLRDFCKTVNFAKHQSTVSNVSITEVTRTDGLRSLWDDELRCLGIRFYPCQKADTLGLLEKMFRAHVTVGAGDEGRATLVTDQRGDLRVRFLA